MVNKVLYFLKLLTSSINFFIKNINFKIAPECMTHQQNDVAHADTEANSKQKSKTVANRSYCIL